MLQLAILRNATKVEQDEKEGLNSALQLGQALAWCSREFEGLYPMVCCQGCGETIRPNARLCLKCGKPVSESLPRELSSPPSAVEIPGEHHGEAQGILLERHPAHKSHGRPALAVSVIVCLAAVAVVAVLATRHQHQLTRDDAVRFLRAANAVQSASYFRVTKSEQSAMDPRGCFQFQNKPGWQALTDLGWATLDIKATSEPTAFAYAWYGCTLQLTPEGAQQANHWRPWSGPLDMSGWEIPLATAQFLDVVGITKTESDAAQVQYSFRWNPAPFAQSLGRMPDSGIRGGLALFRRFDDDWRLQDSGFGSLPEPQISETQPIAPSGQADWTAYITNEHVSTTVNFDLSPDVGSTWQSFSLAPRTMGIYKRMNRFRLTTNFPDGQRQTVNCPLPTHGLKYYSINCQGENCGWDLYGDDEFVALARANK